MPYTEEELKQITPLVDFSIDPIQSLEDIKKYYADLLILQYRNKPKARATVQIGCDIYTGNGLLFEFENILDIDRASDYTLDIIGNILGVPRNVLSDTPNVDFFTFEKSNANGFSTVGKVSKGIFKRSDRNYYNKNALSNKNYRILIKLKAILNSVRATWADMDSMYYRVFGNNLYFENNKDGTITYFYNSNYFDKELWNAIIKLEYLKAPLGISYTIQEVTNNG